MLKIYIDTAERLNKFVRLIELSENVEKNIDTLSGDIDIVTAIKNICEKNNLKIEQIDEFTFNEGPGSFTGLKAGATIANILNWALHEIPLSKIKYPVYGSEPNISLKNF